ncbi:MAG TPA: PKD domain-containing protein, partial [Thioalkalivibrio sp.]|nr:PKD domain-containing protein [Thioalkalivibrio sp.]
ASSRAGVATASVTDTTSVPRIYGVSLTPDGAQTILPGTAYTYTHQLANTGNATDTFQLALTSTRGWATLASTDTYTLPAAGAVMIPVRVDAPSGSGGLVDVARLTAVSVSTGTVTARVTDTSTSLYTSGLILEPDNQATVLPPAHFTYTHWLTNTGTGADLFALDFQSSQGWGTLVESGPVPLAAGEGISLHVEIDVPVGTGGMVETSILTATAQSGGISARVTDIVSVTHLFGIDLFPDYQQSVPPGAMYIYQHVLHNTGNGPDTFTLDFASSHGHSTLLDTGPITLGADETTSVRVSVTVPTGVISGTLVEVAVVTATSQTDPGTFDAATDTTIAAFVPGMSFAPDHVETGASVGDTFTYTHWLTNTSNYTDTFELDFDSSAGWGTLLDTGPFTLGVGDVQTVRVEVTVPSGGSGQSDTSVVTATSQGGAGPLLVRDTTAAFDPGVAFAPDRSHWLNPGESYTYTHWLTNTGTSTDTIALSLDSSRGWTRLLDDGPFTLAANQSISVSVQVTAPLGSGGLTDVTVLDASTLNGAGPSAQVTDTTMVTYTPGVALGPNHDETVPAGSAIQYTHYLTNTGDGPDTFSLAMDSSQGWATLLDGGPFALLSGESAPVRVEVAVPTDTLPFEVDVTTITATAAAVGDLQATATDTTTVACISISNPGFDLTPSTVIANRPVTFTGRVAAGSPSIAYEWDFDDGSGVQSGNPMAHTFASVGAYTVVMTATNICPSTETMSKTVNVVNAPDITVNPLALDVIQGIDQVLTHTLTIGNEGTLNLSWNLTEIPTRTWLSESPVGGSVAPSSEQVVEVVFDSHGLGFGVYTTTLRIGSNDPDEPLVLVPVTMTVDIVQPPPTIYLPLVMRNH